MMRNKAVIHYTDGTVLKGHVTNFQANKDEFNLQTLEGEVYKLNISGLKAIFFAKDHEGNEHREDEYKDVIAGGGRKIAVTFLDGEVMIGYTSSYSPKRAGFFVVPADKGSNNERVFVVVSSCKDVKIL